MITIALVVGVALATLGVGFVVISALSSGPTTGSSLPVSTAAAKGSAVPTATPQPGASASVLPPTQQPSAGDHGKVRPSELEQRLVTLTNQARSQAGCGTVRVSSRLHSLARAHSTDMARHGYLGHQGSNGSTYPQRAQRAGVAHPTGEAIARGPATAEAVLQAWLSNPDGRGAVLNCNAQTVGAGVAVAQDGTIYWTEDFAA